MTAALLVIEAETAARVAAADPPRTRREAIAAAVDDWHSLLDEVGVAAIHAADAAGLRFEQQERFDDTPRTEIQVRLGAEVAGWEVDRLLREAARRRLGRLRTSDRGRVAGRYPHGR